MKVSNFVSGSALILAGWLGATFIHQVSPLQYPRQTKGNASARNTTVPVLQPTPSPLPQPLETRGMATAGSKQ
ncbi:MAG: hypothetical protein K9N23_05330 [Akkermansiaceae bacterium]|nr:hypothetical protein [Akkermansiaceae bacterium]